MIIDTCPTCHQIVDEEEMPLTIEQAHIDADDHARRCDDENCGWCDYDSSDVDYGDATPSA